MAPRRSPGPRRLLLAAAGALWLLVAPAVHGVDRSVLVLTATGVVDNVMAGYLEEGIALAERDARSAVVIKLDTLGGALDATERIVKAELESDVPVIVWVSPAGAKADSAGTFITLAANLAYMAPGSNIGAASPVDSSGGDIGGTLGEKVKNDAIAYITSIAERRGRNVAWAVSTVESARSSAATEAVAVGAVNGIAETLDGLLQAADGQKVTVAGGSVVTVAVGAATISDAAMNPFQGFLHLLSDPNIAFILFTIGFYGLIFELQNPNFVTGILGALAIILALIGFGSLPLNVGGLLLIVLGIILMILELTVVSHGLLTAAGLLCFVLGASALYTSPGSPEAPDVTVAFPLIATMAITTLLFFGLAIGAVVRSRRRYALEPLAYGVGGSGTGSMTVPAGTGGEVRVPLDPIGTVYAAGEEWTARSAGAAGRIERGARIRVTGQQGLTLIVEPDRAAGPAA
jgi:membrane-bound serine protease (ClpP class)